MIRFIKFILVVGASLFVIVSCNQSNWYQAIEHAKAENRAALAVPKVVSKTDDGCTVYSFYTDTTHYFTRCGTTTTTDRNYTQSTGKISMQKTESITTENQ
jgi:hypothetical protein